METSSNPAAVEMTAHLSRLPAGARQAMQSLIDGFAPPPQGAAEDIQTHLRRLALERFRAQGFPDRRSEAWRYTDLIGALEGPLPPSPRANDSETPSRGELPDSACTRAAAGLQDEITARLVFVDGAFDPARSNIGNLPAGTSLQAGDAPPLANGAGGGSEGADMLENLNHALARSGFTLNIDEGAHCPGVIHLLFLKLHDAPCSLHVRGRIHLGAGARLRLLESHIGCSAAPCLQTRLTDCTLEREATLHHACIDEHAAADVSLSRMTAGLHAGARLDCAVLGLGGRIARREYDCAFLAPQAQVRLSALALARGGELRDINARMNHQIGECSSDTLIKSVLAAQARGVFQGLVRVAPGAAGSDGRQVSKALLLGEGAHMNAKPELEIFNDDVECAHGSAIGELDADALFYLRSRGIDIAAARRLLIAAFLADVFARLDEPALAEALRARAGAWLDAFHSPAGADAP